MHGRTLRDARRPRSVRAAGRNGIADQRRPTATLKEYRAKHGFHVDMLSDFRRDVSRLYGVLLAERYYSNRAYFLLDGKGIVRWEHVESNPSDRRLDSEIFDAIDAVVKLG